MTVRTRAELEVANRRVYDSVREFNRAIADYADSLPAAFVAPFHRKIHLRAVNGVVKRTPVGKRETWANNIERAAKGLPPVPKGYAGGHARRNWQSSTSGPAQAEQDGIDPTGRQAEADGQRKTLGIRAYTQSFISNPVPYIEPLEAGSSTLAPNGMVAVTVEELRNLRED